MLELNDVVKNLIVSLCQFHVVYTKNLDIYGSIQILSDGKDVTAFLINEHLTKSNNETTINTTILTTHKDTNSTENKAKESLSDEAISKSVESESRSPVNVPATENLISTTVTSRILVKPQLLLKRRSNAFKAKLLAHKRLKKFHSSTLYKESTNSNHNESDVNSFNHSQNLKNDEPKIEIDCKQEIIDLDYNDESDYSKPSHSVDDNLADYLQNLKNDYESKCEEPFPSMSDNDIYQSIFNQQLSNQKKFSSDYLDFHHRKYAYEGNSDVAKNSSTLDSNYEGKPNILSSNPCTSEQTEYRVECMLCGLQYKSQDGLSCHINTKHLRKRVYSCTFCEQQFFTRQACYWHRTRNHKGCKR